MTPLKNYSIVFILLLFLFPCSIKSIDTTSTKYYPLQIGNSWTYHCYQFVYPGPILNSKVKFTITTSSIINGHQYFSGALFNSIRIDSINGKLLQSTSNGCNWLTNERLIDSLSSRLNDSCRANCENNYFTKCTDTSSITIFGLSRPTKVFNRPMFEMFWSDKYTKGIGLIYNSFSSLANYTYYELLGCVINGIVYGDTSLLGINKITSEVPKSFKLSQNYPNPFNPTTKIKFSLLHPSEGGEWKVQLIIYDVLGRKIASLIPPLRGGQEGLSPGTYEVEWDGSNYASGVYYYKLIISDPETGSGLYYTETKKLILLK